MGVGDVSITSGGTECKFPCTERSVFTMNRHELYEILISDDVDVKLEALQENGDITQLFPAVQGLVGFGGSNTGHKDLWAHTKQVVKQTRPSFILRLAALYHDVGKPRTFRLYPNGEIGFPVHELVGAELFEKDASRLDFLLNESEIKDIEFIIRYLGRVEAYNPDWTDSAVRRLILELGPAADSVLAVAEADCTTKHPAKRMAQLSRVDGLKVRMEFLRLADSKPPALPKGLGDALGAHLGLPPGRELGVIMTELKARVEAGELPRNASFDVYLAAL